MVGEPQRTALGGQLTLLGGPGRGDFGDVETAREQVVDRPRTGASGKAETAPQFFEDAGVLTGAQVEVAAEEQRRIAGPSDRGLRRQQDVGGSELGPVVCRVQVGNAEAGGSARKRHSPPLRPPRVDRQLPPLDDHAVPVRLFPVMGG